MHVLRVGGGELFAFVSEREKLDEEEASGYMRQILEGVRYDRTDLKLVS